MVAGGRWPLRVLAALWVSALACSADGPEATPGPTFEMLFDEVARVSLEEDPADPMVGITSLSRRPAGGWVVTDELDGLAICLSEIHLRAAPAREPLAPENALVQRSDD